MAFAAISAIAWATISLPFIGGAQPSAQAIKLIQEGAPQAVQLAFRPINQVSWEGGWTSQQRRPIASQLLATPANEPPRKRAAQDTSRWQNDWVSTQRRASAAQVVANYPPLGVRKYQIRTWGEERFEQQRTNFAALLAAPANAPPPRKVYPTLLWGEGWQVLPRQEKLVQPFVAPASDFLPFARIEQRWKEIERWPTQQPRARQVIAGAPIAPKVSFVRQELPTRRWWDQEAPRAQRYNKQIVSGAIVPPKTSFQQASTRAISWWGTPWQVLPKQRKLVFAGPSVGPTCAETVFGLILADAIETSGAISAAAIACAGEIEGEIALYGLIFESAVEVAGAESSEAEAVEGTIESSIDLSGFVSDEAVLAEGEISSAAVEVQGQVC